MKRTLLLSVIVCLSLARGAAQEFQSAYRDNDLLDFRALGAGVAPNTFESRADNALPDSLRIKFTSPMMFLEYRQMDIRIALCYNHYELRGEGKSSYAIYADGSTDLPLASRRSGGLFLPIIIATNYVKADGLGNSSGIFDVGSVGIGTGLKFRYLGESFGMQASAGAVIHYSTVGFSVEHGSSTSGKADVQLLFPRLVWKGAAVSYRFETQQWIMTDEKLNYRRMYHGVSVGLFF